MDRLETMRAFVRLVELGTFTAVADELHVGQSTVSKWLVALEDELGVQLIERTTRTRRVTEAGQLFYERAREILAAYDDVSAELSRAPAPSGRLRVSVPVVFGERFVAPAVASFLRRYPDIEIELSLSDRYVNLVEEGFDVAVRVGTPSDSSFVARQLTSTPRRLVASPEYLTAHGEVRTPSALGDHECLLHTGLRSGDVWRLTRDGERFRANVRGRVSANNSAALLSMARAGLGIALLAAWLVDDDIACGHLRAVLPDHELPPAPVQALMPPSRHIHPRVRLFVDFLSDALGALG